MKRTITPLLHQLRSDRPLLVVSLLLLLSGIAYVIYVALSLSPTELQVATRYTAFGGTQYYRNKWYYLIGFIGVGLIMTCTHIGMILKMQSRSMRAMAYAFGWLGLIAILILFLITNSVLGIAYLS